MFPARSSLHTLQFLSGVLRPANGVSCEPRGGGKRIDRIESNLTRPALPALGWRMAMRSRVGAMMMGSKMDSLKRRH